MYFLIDRIIYLKKKTTFRLLILINKLMTCLGICGAVSKIGTMKNLTKFDSTFFNVHPKLAERLDPQIRIMLESTYEAFVDAGVF